MRGEAVKLKLDSFGNFSNVFTRELIIDSGDNIACGRLLCIPSESRLFRMDF